MVPLRIVFMGSPEMAVPALKALLNSGEKVVGVVSQPDRPAGRGREITPPSMARLAREEKIPLFQPEFLKNNPEFSKSLKDLAPDLIVVVAYGRILPLEILNLPPLKCINVHFSLLPKYRGAAPLQWALINGEEETGVTTFSIVEEMDAGPILMQKKVVIEPEDNAGILGNRLAVTGAQLLLETLEGLKSHSLDPVPQNERLATAAPPLKKENGRIDWSRKARTIFNQIRGMNPWPGAYTTLNGKLLKIYRAEATAGKKGLQPGEAVPADAERLEITCGQGALLLKEVQWEGGRKMGTADFLKGHPVPAGSRLG